MASTRIQELSDDDIRNMCDIVHRQTDYTIDQIMDKLIEYDYNHIDIIKDYMGIVVAKPYKIESIQQEIYKQLRFKLDAATKDFNDGQYDKLKKELEDDT
jgi:ribosomal protein S13